MEFNKVEYIQDISFNDTCDRMVISTISRKIIIYKKVNKNSDCLILDPEKEKEKEKEKGKKHHLFDSDNESSEDKSIDIKKLKKPIFKSISFNDQNNFINQISNEFNYDSDFNPDLNDQINDPSKKNSNYEYRWEPQLTLNTDGPVFRIQWADSEFGNLFACCGYNKWVYIFKEEKVEKNLVWNNTPIKAFSDSVVDISFLPKIYSLQLASVTSDGFLKISKPLN